eukprot:CAMPEP_0198579004 /NCGR_PEP_ID=MMETSP1462-20131121/120953_1 /TAXON_ID=1333877 /ORGANISM="Brandtodinium nutriculum, Strain RCC3387" /LENGTH=146 /DNA_ID=CAMNT_0044310315 /DNA_START=312 /DNA_END=752 /DNA_ORIENTATION=-
MGTARRHRMLKLLRRTQRVAFLGAAAAFMTAQPLHLRAGGCLHVPSSYCTDHVFVWLLWIAHVLVEIEFPLAFLLGVTPTWLNVVKEGLDRLNTRSRESPHCPAALRWVKDVRAPTGARRPRHAHLVALAPLKNRTEAVQLNLAGK